MATYKLHVPDASFRAFAPLIAAEYNGVDVDISTDLSGASLSPTGKLPLLEIQNKAGATTGRIFSSQAIARYLAGIRRDTGLMGSGNVAEQASIDSWIDFSAQDLELPACVWFYPVAGYMPFSADAYEKAKNDLAAGLSVLEKHLASKTFLVGEQVTLADIVVASTLLYPFKLVCDKEFLKGYTNVVRWFQTCTSQAEFEQVVGKVTMCKKEIAAPGATISNNNNSNAKAAQSTPASAPAPAAASESRRVVNILVKPKAGVECDALWKKMNAEIKSQPEYKLKWDANVKFESGKIYASFTINEEADFHEEVMDYIEMMEDEVDDQDIVFQTVME